MLEILLAVALVLYIILAGIKLLGILSSAVIKIIEIFR